jgi:c-di-GMP-binding flagellar brake protein YcgR
MVPTYEPLGAERRETDRFPIESELRYKLIEARRLAETGQGRTLNMSSGGILFTAETPIPVGRRVELSVDWPARLNGNCGLRLVALGKVVRSDMTTAAVRIEKYDFHTCATAALTARASSL